MDYRQIPAFCINMDTRPDRWERVRDRFASLEWSVERIPGVVHTEETVNGINGQHAGATDSHRAAWQLCLDRKYPVIAVFEDDVVFPSDFKDIFARVGATLPSDWQLWHLHSSHAQVTKINKYLVRYRGVGWGAHGYLIRPRACHVLLNRVPYANCDVMLTDGYLQNNGQPLGTAMSYALCFQDGDDESNIPVTDQQKYWRTQREIYCR